MRSPTTSSRPVLSRPLVRAAILVLTFLWLGLAASVSARIAVTGDAVDQFDGDRAPAELPREWVWRLPDRSFDDMYSRPHSQIGLRPTSND